MLKRHFKHLKKKFLYNFKRHIWSQWRSGQYSKPFHFLKIIIRHKLLDYPYLGLIETTNTCNLQCPTCTTPRHLLERKPKIMTMEEFKRIVDQIKNYVHVVLLYDTNEPLTNPRITEMIKYCDKNNLFTSISTNATLLTREKTHEILDAGLDEALLCLDGMSKESYEPFRVGAKFEEAKENIKYFCEEKNRRGLARPYLELQFILTKLNQHEVPQIKQFAKELKVDRLRIKSLAMGDYAFSKEELRYLSEKFLPIEKGEYKNKIIYDRKDDGTISIRRKRDLVWICGQAKTQACVLADGRLSICCYDIKGHYIYGNLHQQTMKEIMKSDKYKKMKESAKAGKYPLCDICGEY